jgi:hypothetical protein
MRLSELSEEASRGSNGVQQHWSIGGSWQLSEINSRVAMVLWREDWLAANQTEFIRRALPWQSSQT